MKINIKYDIHLACKIILQEHLEKMGIPYDINDLGVIHIEGNLSQKQFEKLEASLKKYGIEIVDDHKSSLVQQIKQLILEVVYMNDKLPDPRISVYISRKLNLSYSYLSRVFSEATYSSIETYLILQRIERVKELIIDDKLTFTEVAWKMNYSSVAHLSNQFKKTTGLTPTEFQRIIEKKKSRYLMLDTT